MWRPLIAILALPSSLPRSKRIAYSVFKEGPFIQEGYCRRDIKTTHSSVGGVTEAEWYFVHFNRLGIDLGKEALMMAPQFSRPLQAALDDTRGPPPGKKVVFEARKSTPLPKNIACHVTIPRLVHKAPVYDTRYLAPDVGTLPGKDRSIWVQASSVFTPRSKVVRQVNHAELFSIWDYEGKYESKHWQDHITRSVLKQRLASPPAKMLRSFVFSAGGLLIPSCVKERDTAGSQPVGKTEDIPFSPLEEEASVRVKAAQADDAGVDLSQWAEPSETPRVANARAVLRRFVVRWWVKYQERHAMEWIKSQGHEESEEDIKAIADCIRRAMGCTYWS